ncbi:hypothetical protein N1851_017514 [Merluccius polli]|uniref:Uncharacterized protein n=1 Tax=Merluccius polli TaxID=89951 RepID=A0AA47NYZ8_MERPO|nr:hypothetical protein N1851_017514 [Merluccius polli]
MDPDNINPRVLKACAGQLAGVFQHLFNLSEGRRRCPRCGRAPALFWCLRKEVQVLSMTTGQ